MASSSATGPAAWDPAGEVDRLEDEEDKDEEDEEVPGEVDVGIAEALLDGDATGVDDPPHADNATTNVGIVTVSMAVSRRDRRGKGTSWLVLDPQTLRAAKHVRPASESARPPGVAPLLSSFSATVSRCSGKDNPSNHRAKVPSGVLVALVLVARPVAHLVNLPGELPTTAPPLPTP